MHLNFGTSGLRGLSEELKGEPSARYATAFARYLVTSGHSKPGDPILIARDFRDSSPEIAAVCAAALSREGLRVLDCGTVPTPALALYGLANGAAGLMITGSHIPADRNGIKFYRPDGEIDKTDEVAISQIADGIAHQIAPVADAGIGEDHAAQAAELFLERNRTLLPKGTLSGLKVGVYQHSTVARDLIAGLLAFFGADVVALGRSEHFVPVDTEAVSAETVERLQGWAREHRLDAIVSADGDGDRPLVADENGLPLRGDLLGLIACSFLGATRAVTPVTSNSGLERRLSIVRTRVGSPFVIAGMQQALKEGAANVAGFEANGGTLTASAFVVNGGELAALPTRDSFLPIVATLAAAAGAKLSLSALAASYRLPVALSDRLENFAVETSSRLMAHLRASEAKLAVFLAPIGRPIAVSDIDGLRVTLDDGRIIHFRPSGNAPEMRCYVEAETVEEAEVLLATGLSTIRQWAKTASN
ncbi:MULTISPECIES: phosphomannomutase [unclassified Ensifer]|uniref:phosphomannomutase n=1 Tax=unclassified Ensifer TaxID=2633371 RepID=UPI0008131726|nr:MULTISPECIES: phosphomannomutase [unclassified Ensifer]OCO98685.1 phosphomannomutase [Ensifer sp. LC14]OCP13164.1 phosphomannomutase [Ensifer sp. LC13]OCP13769.1 phosphomannomutase [Ensifer sp. LC11]OCP28145.1 phosphomannomutase [Ensifer sp. LC499]